MGGLGLLKYQLSTGGNGEEGGGARGPGQQVKAPSGRDHANVWSPEAVSPHPASLPEGHREAITLTLTGIKLRIARTL